MLGDLRKYTSRHRIPSNYLLSTLLEGAPIDLKMESKNLSTDYNLKLPHFADIIYSMVQAKGLDLPTVCQFINLGQASQGKVKMMDVELSNSLRVIDKLFIAFSERMPHKEESLLREMALGTFPLKSDYVNHPIKPAFSEISFARIYLSSIISFCEEHKRQQLNNEPLQGKNYISNISACGSMVLVLSLMIGMIMLKMLWF